MQTGTYRFSLLRTEADGEVEFDADAGTVEILVSSSLSFGDRTRFEFSGGISLPSRVKFHYQGTSQVTIGTDIIPFTGTLVSPLAQVKAFSRTVFRGAVYAEFIDFEPEVVVHYVPLLTPGVELPEIYPPTYIPGQTSFLDACQEAFDNPPPGGLPEGSEWVPACSTAIQNQVFTQKVTNQIPGRDLGSNPPKIADMTVFPLNPTTSEGNAVMEVVYDEPMPDTVNFVWLGDIKTAKDNGSAPDQVAGDGIYTVVLEVDFGSLPAPEEGEEGIPVPIFGRDIVRQSSLPTGEVDLSALAVPDPLLKTCGDVHTHVPPDSDCPAHPGKIFMIRDLDIVNDPERTSDPCLVIEENQDPLTEATKKWTFGYLMSQMVSPEQLNAAGTRARAASDFALNWLDNWHETFTINGQKLRNLSGEFAGTDNPTNSLPKRLRDRWLEASARVGAPTGEVLMKLAPFRLLAIVNRFDLREASSSGGELAGGELRFVFTPLTLPAGGPAAGPCMVHGLNNEDEIFDHTVILEYAVDLAPRLDEDVVRAWAEDWLALDGINMFDPQGVDQYLQALEALTEQVVVAGQGGLFERANGSALRQLRTNETVNNTDWDFREFVIDDFTHKLLPATVKKAPADVLNETGILGQWIIDNKAAYNADNVPVPDIPGPVPAGYPSHPVSGAGYFLGARTINSTTGALNPEHRVGGFWQPASGFLDYTDPDDRKARHRLSLNACSACHGKETEQPAFDGNAQPFFAHVMPRRYGEESQLSNFLAGLPANPDNLNQNPVFVPDPVTVGTNVRLKALTWTGSQFVAVGEDPESGGGQPITVASSPDGGDFTLSNIGSGSLQAIDWNGAEAVAVGEGGELFSSPDGLTWNGLNSGVIPNDLNAIMWVAGHPESDRWVAVGAQGVVTTSTDGVVWNGGATGQTNTLYGLAWNGVNLVAVGEGGRILNSPDGNVWSEATGATSATLRSVAWAGNQFVAVGEGVILTSPAGFTWTLRLDNFPVNFRSVTWTGSEAVAVGSEGAVLSSTGGINWTTHTSPTTFGDFVSLNSVVWTGTELAVAGDEGAFYTAPGPEGPWSPVGERDRYRYFEDLRARLEILTQFLDPSVSNSPSILSFQPVGRVH